MATMPFFPLATDAYLADTAHLTDAEHGRYIQLLIALWRAPRQRLPDNDDWLARKFHRDPERVRSELRPLIVEFCQTDGNWITQKRLSKEFARATKAVNQRRDAANARWLKEKEASERTAASYGSRNAPTLIPTPTYHDHEGGTKTGSDPAPTAPRLVSLRGRRDMGAELAMLAAKKRGQMQ